MRDLNDFQIVLSKSLQCILIISSAYELHYVYDLKLKAILLPSMNYYECGPLISTLINRYHKGQEQRVAQSSRCNIRSR
jgi:hypothetical protein